MRTQSTFGGAKRTTIDRNDVHRAPIGSFGRCDAMRSSNTGIACCCSTVAGCPARSATLGPVGLGGHELDCKK